MKEPYNTKEPSKMKEPYDTKKPYKTMEPYITKELLNISIFQNFIFSRIF